MAVLKILLKTSFIVGLVSIARPPVDLIFPATNLVVKPKKGIRESDITFTSIDAFTPQEKFNNFLKQNKGKTYKVAVSTFGYQLPNTSSEKISALRSNSFVVLIKNSKNEKWGLISKYENGKKSWVHLSRLKEVDYQIDQAN